MKIYLKIFWQWAKNIWECLEVVPRWTMPHTDGCWGLSIFIKLTSSKSECYSIKLVHLGDDSLANLLGVVSEVRGDQHQAVAIILFFSLLKTLTDTFVIFNFGWDIYLLYLQNWFEILPQTQSALKQKRPWQQVRYQALVLPPSTLSYSLVSCLVSQRCVITINVVCCWSV